MDGQKKRKWREGGTGGKEGGKERRTYLGSRADDEAVILRDYVQQFFLRQAHFVINFMSTLLKDLDAHLGRMMGGREGGRGDV